MREFPRGKLPRCAIRVFEAIEGPEAKRREQHVWFEESCFAFGEPLLIDGGTTGQESSTRPLHETEWVPPDLRKPPSFLPLVGLVPVGIAGASAWAIAGPVAGLGTWAITAAAVVVWSRVQGGLALRSVTATRIANDGGRFRNLVEGLSAGADMKPPELWVIPEGGPNALVCRGPRPSIAVTENLLNGYSRLELEAVAAHCVARIRSLDKLSIAVALGPVGAQILGPVGRREDAAAVQLTRYPPALAAAIEKAEPRTSRFGLFWFVGGSGTHEPQSERARALLDL
jgi:hypothetical protein